MPGRRPGGGLRQGIDNEVYTIVLRLLEADEGLDATVPAVYQAIQRSNSSLKRKPKRVLEDSLERVLSALDEDDDEAELDEVHNNSLPAADVNIMNKSLTSAWKPATGTPNGTSRAQSTEPQRKRKREEKDKDRERERPASTAAKREPTIPTDASFDDLGGIEKLVEQLEEMIYLPLRGPPGYSALSLPLPRGVLLHGPPGCGKSTLARACAAESGVPLVEILGPSIVSGMSGESEKQVREIFEEARKAAPCIIFIDEIDVIAPKRDTSQSQMEKRIVAQLLVSMDSLAMDNKTEGQRPVIVLAATNRPDSLDPALRRGGRFDTEINLGVPSERGRAAILRSLTRSTPLSSDVDFDRLARMTPGYVGADLRDLVGKAGSYSQKTYVQALKDQAAAIIPTDANLSGDLTQMEIDPMPARSCDEVVSFRLLHKRCCDDSIPEPPGFEHRNLSMGDFLAVLPSLVPSSKREGFATIPDTTWENIGALAGVRKELQRSVVNAIRYPEKYANLGVTPPGGVLLWGPPGCGKTLLAKAVANESKANFISIKGPELLNKFVGESERALRTVFTRARSSIPCVIFFDELDALVPKRDDNVNEASARVVNTLLTELDGVGSREGIYVIAATNRPDIIDDALLRPGRLELLLYVDLPGPAERAEILATLVKQSPKADLWPSGASLAGLARGEECHGFSGADLEALVRKTGLEALDRGADQVSIADFQTALTTVKPSVTSMTRYERLKGKFGMRS
ncbi:hypothetical protein ANO11243_057160 [Dothideomycetidae sp. 11243]|nr:hypothetical protein ANO11243_057160 [fungal sp. No.11243]